jgi:hypothetical protein
LPISCYFCFFQWWHTLFYPAVMEYKHHSFWKTTNRSIIRALVINLTGWWKWQEKYCNFWAAQNKKSTLNPWARSLSRCLLLNNNSNADYFFVLHLSKAYFTVNSIITCTFQRDFIWSSGAFLSQPVLFCI